MKLFRGKAFNIQKDLILKIFKIQDTTYYAKNERDIIAIGTKKNNFNSFFLCNNCEFHIGDIIRLSPNGEIIVLYEKNINDNALFITEQCNNNCIMCPQILRKNSPSYYFENKEIISLIDVSPDVIGLTGGEPTMAWKELIDLIKYITDKHPATTIQLLTNGRIFSQIQKVKEISLITNNILYCIPLYSEIEEIHNKIVGNSRAFSETINGLYNLARFKQSVELRTVVNKINYIRLPQWSDWICYNLPFVSHVVLMGLELTYNAMKNYKDIWIDPIHYRDYLSKSCKILKQNDIPFYIYNHQLCVVEPWLWKNCCSSISNFKIIYLDECQNCLKKNICGGFFNSTKNKHSIGIQAIKE